MASVTACTRNRAALFVDSEVIEVFVAVLEEAARRYACTVPAYCFMPDHLHLILKGERPEADLWGAMIEFKQRSGFWLYRHRGGSAWQKDFHDHLLRRDEDVVAHVRYIVENPCRRGLAATWDEYPFTGAIGCGLEEVLAGLPPSRYGYARA